ncbi:putative RNA-binding Zn ribbon-like protein [Streptomyces sp. V4I23]|uniref:CGNR zinc finger domain-containing protein n=1 Tax=Streptomyces sp. V4I23 TaxID=3042282 RepID=UPI0027815F44|nr:CGNR zinc finger domain-containing protein [Streptomyces sp. V4I23]MDQ1010378.1 putative RNA-binding Zn ribbon-like protein [Streptomyces sp. V4I23]
MNDRAPAPGGLALIEALVNTLDIDSGADSLDAPEAQARFALTPQDVPAARVLREALREACLAHAGHGTSTALDALLADAPLRVTVSPSGEAALRPSGPPTLLARVAEAVATGAADGTWMRLKACEADDCQWAYYDRSPAARSRWCSMAVCGARAKMRTYRARRTAGAD